MDDVVSSRTLFLTRELSGLNGVPLINKLYELDAESNEDITIFICSPGGRVDNCIGIIDAMNNINSDVCTVAIGGAASAAAAVFCSGTKGKRYITKNSELMFHMPRGGWVANSSGVKLAYGMKSFMEEILVRATGKEKSVIQQDMRLELYMGAEKAIEYGVADEII